MDLGNLARLVEQRAALDQEIDTLSQAVRADAIAEARRLVEAFSFSAHELGVAGSADAYGQRLGRRAPRGPARPRFRDPSSGAMWSGRGKEPRWLAGKDRDEFRI